MNKKIKSIFLIIIATLSTALGIILIPQITPLGIDYINLISAIILICFICIFIIPMIKKEGAKSHSRIYTITNSVETSVLALLAVILIIAQFMSNINFETPAMKFFGLILTLHSSMCLIKKYLDVESRTKQDLYLLLLDIIIIILGCFFMFNSLITNEIFLIILATLLISLGVVLLIINITKLVKQSKKTDNKTPKNNFSEDSKQNSNVENNNEQLENSTTEQEK